MRLRLSNNITLGMTNYKKTDDTMSVICLFTQTGNSPSSFFSLVLLSLLSAVKWRLHWRFVSCHQHHFQGVQLQTRSIKFLISSTDSCSIYMLYIATELMKDKRLPVEILEIVEGDMKR